MVTTLGGILTVGICIIIIMYQRVTSLGGNEYMYFLKHHFTSLLCSSQFDLLTAYL